jgi:cation transport regulator ChaC
MHAVLLGSSTPAGSTDHRGVPGRPGRVVTLCDVDELGNTGPALSTWGIAFRIHGDKIEDTMAYLDFREKGGYSLQTVLFYPDDDQESPFEVRQLGRALGVQVPESH